MILSIIYHIADHWRRAHKSSPPRLRLDGEYRDKQDGKIFPTCRGSYWSISTLVEDQRSHLDALARRRAGGRRRIDERGVWCEPRVSISGGVVALQQKGFIGRHLWEIEPTMPGTELH